MAEITNNAYSTLVYLLYLADTIFNVFNFFFIDWVKISSPNILNEKLKLAENVTQRERMKWIFLHNNMMIEILGDVYKKVNINVTCKLQCVQSVSVRVERCKKLPQ